jgi:hypothetical protein
MNVANLAKDIDVFVIKWNEHAHRAGIRNACKNIVQFVGADLNRKVILKCNLNRVCDLDLIQTSPNPQLEFSGGSFEHVTRIKFDLHTTGKVFD